MGNGAAIKRGARAASGEILVFMDADGQHDPACIDAVLAKMDEGYDMVVGARDWAGQAGVHRGAANAFYNWLASRMTGFKVLDLRSEEHTSELQSLMRISYAVFCLKNKKIIKQGSLRET